jgi:hypothetical protein
MFPYVGAVLSYLDPEGELRERSLMDVKKYVSDAQYQTFTHGSPYVETVARDDKAFLEQLPGYRVKPLYILLTGLVGTALGNIALASTVVSSAGFLLMGVALYLLRPKGSSESFYLVVTMLLVSLGTPAFTLLPSVSSPDSLATGLMLLGLWALLRRPHAYLPVVWLSLAVLARPDSIVTIACMLPFTVKVCFEQRTAESNRRFMATTAILPFFVYACSRLAFPSFSMSQLIVFAFEGPFPHLSSIDTSHFWNVYKTALGNDLTALFSLPRFTALLITNIVLLIFFAKSSTKYLLFAALANISLKIILFPNFDGGFGERFFATSYFFIIYSLFKIIDGHPHRNNSRRLQP